MLSMLSLLFAAPVEENIPPPNDAPGGGWSMPIQASTFAEDGFTTRVTDWELEGEPVYDVYVTDLASFTQAAELARRLADAGWDSADVAILPTANELEGE